MDKRKRIYLMNFSILLLAALMVAAHTPAQARTSGKFQRDFQEVEGPLHNPLMGYAFPATTIGAAAQSHLVYVDVTWREWEPEMGVYDAKSLRERASLDRWQKEGKHVVFRFLADRPSSSESTRDIPDWLYEQTGKDGQWYSTGYGMGFAPNFENPYIIQRHALAVAALGKHFGQDTFFSYIELGSLGHWGEWHTNSLEGVAPLPKQTIMDQYVQPYYDAFPNARLMMRYPLPWVKEQGMGIYNDMLGDAEQTRRWLKMLSQGGVYEHSRNSIAYQPVPRIWESAPVGGEFTSGSPFSVMLDSRLEQTLSMLESSHMTFIGPKAPLSHQISESERQGADKVLEHIGYRYWVSHAAGAPDKNGDLRVTLNWKNSGPAPMYWDWPVYLYVLDAGGKTLSKHSVDLALSGLYEGQSAQTETVIPVGALPAGGYRIAVGIVDPMTGQAAVTLAMSAQQSGCLSILHAP